MGDATLDADDPFLEQPQRAAAVLCRTEHGSLHAGVLYRNKDAAAVLHLGWQDTLSQDWPWERLWAAPEVEPERLVAVAGLCRRIMKVYRQTQRFPYALRFDGSSFDPQGRLVLGPRSRGLTCATFVLAVFKTLGVVLVDEPSWPVRPSADRAFLESVRCFARPDHFAVLSAEVDAGCARIRPDEVLGACACQPPAAFAPARHAADRVLATLDAPRRSSDAPA